MCHRLLLALLAVSAAHADSPPVELSPVVEGLHDPMELTVAPDGDLYVIEREGRVLRVRPATGGLFEIGRLEVTALRENDPDSPFAREDGMLGITLDPKFSENRRLYLYYSAPDKLLNRLSRFTLKDGKLDPASEKMLLEVPTLRDKKVCHHGGSLSFGPDGLLYLSTGDNTNPFESNGHAPIDNRGDREHFDAGRSAGNSNDLRGKILRIRPTEDGYTIPPGNLFPPGTPKTRPEIYVMGCRNPFRISIDPKNRNVYWGEVGPDAGGESPRGPRGYDEVNQARKAGNFGWPFVIADNKPYPIVDFTTGKPGAMTDPAAPVNPSPRNTGISTLPPAQPALIWYPYANSTEFPTVGGGGRNAMAGPVFYYDAGRKWNLLGKGDDHTLLTYDWMRGKIWKAKLDASDKLVSLDPLVGGLMHPMDLEMEKDGTLWLLEYGSNWWFNKNGRIRRLRPDSGNKPPVLEIAKVAGQDREYEVKTLSDPEQDTVSFRWFLTTGATEKDLGNDRKVTVPAGEGSELRAVAVDAKGLRTVKRVPLVSEEVAPTLAIAFTGAPAKAGFGDALSFKITAPKAPDAKGVVVRARYIPPTGHDSGGPEFSPEVRERITTGLCLACHQVDKASVGPGYLDVALRYQGRADAVDYLKGRLKNGSTGDWGEIPMPPQTALADADADTIVRAILGLAAGMSETRGTIAGSLKLPAAPANAAPGGAWEIIAQAPGYQNARVRIDAK